MSEDHPDVFLNYIETAQERERVLALLHPDVRAVVEQYMADHPGISAKKAINATGGLSSSPGPGRGSLHAAAGGVNGRRGGVSRPSRS